MQTEPHPLQCVVNVQRQTHAKARYPTEISIAHHSSASLGPFSIFRYFELPSGRYARSGEALEGPSTMGVYEFGMGDACVMPRIYRFAGMQDPRNR